MFVVLGLGSNRSFDSHSCMDLLSMAIERIGGFVSNLSVSSVYRTAAMYVVDQEDFYNMVVTGDFEGSPRQLLDDIHRVESELGRDRTKEFRNGPRSIDIDIEFYGKERVAEPDLVIPHERIEERAFVLKPLLEIIEKDADKINADISFLEKRLEQLADQRVEKLSV
ncbi:MAG: 2-amino-4-hydroxy-6-hydroxymethyldihydropteridine diphosphokinase [Treponema sp.]|nr:2-amino-4-hydroxy-6-hydroxymethyldihydropteridine diphosphokinase [Candidatus Treponema equi]